MRPVPDRKVKRGAQQRFHQGASPVVKHNIMHLERGGWVDLQLSHRDNLMSAVETGHLEPLEHRYAVLGLAPAADHLEVASFPPE